MKKELTKLMMRRLAERGESELNTRAVTARLRSADAGVRKQFGVPKGKTSSEKSAETRRFNRYKARMQKLRNKMERKYGVE